MKLNDLFSEYSVDNEKLNEDVRERLLEMYNVQFVNAEYIFYVEGDIVKALPVSEVKKMREEIFKSNVYRYVYANINFASMKRGI